MAVKVRNNGEWVDIETGFSVIPPSPTGITGYWQDITSSRDRDIEYVNLSTNITYQSVSYKLSGPNTSSTRTALAGSSLHSYIKDPSSSTWIKSAITRDNGTNASENVILSVRFLVPNNYSYKVILFDNALNQWGSSPGGSLAITKLSWSQFVMQLYYS